MVRKDVYLYQRRRSNSIVYRSLTLHVALVFALFFYSFWWGGRPGPDGTRRLYQITHDYLKYDKNLTNLIWTWNIQDFGTLLEDADAYNPGDEVCVV